MKKLLIFCFVLFSVTVFAQNYQRYLVDTLSSSSFDGRGYVNQGAKRAAGFIKKQFDSLGLKPLNNSYYQTLPIRVNIFPGTMKLLVNGQFLLPGQDYLIDPVSGGGKAMLKAVSVNVYDKGQMKKLLNSKKYINKILIIHKPDTLSGERIGEFGALIQALGDLWPILVLSDEKLTWSVGNIALKFPVFWVNLPGLDKIEKVEYEVEQRIVNLKTNNVMGVVKGTGNNQKYLLITAHYDHLGRMGSETYFPGANDNASGVAELLSLAAYLSKNPLSKNLLFIAFAGEEAGLIGSKYFTNNSPIPLDSIDFVLNLDLSGTGNEGITVVNATLFPKVFDQLDSLNKKGGYVAAVKKRGPAANSDHYFFTEKNVPAFFIYTLGGIKAYHDIYDKRETLPLTEAADLKQLYIQFFNYLDSVERPVKSNAGVK